LGCNIEWKKRYNVATGFIREFWEINNKGNMEAQVNPNEKKGIRKKKSKKGMIGGEKPNGCRKREV